MAETAASPAHKVYNIAHWSDGYISVNGQGEVEICPDRGRSDARINLPALTRSLTDAGVALPVGGQVAWQDLEGGKWGGHRAIVGEPAQACSAPRAP